MTPASILRLWFRWDVPVGRFEYFASGLFLALVKFVGDVTLANWAGGLSWTPFDYVRPMHLARAVSITGVERWLLPAMFVWMLPFLWIGITLSARRAQNAGKSGWLCLAFFIPFINYMLMALLSLLPTDVAPPHVARDGRSPSPDRDMLSWLAAAAAGVGIGVTLVAIGAAVLMPNYGAGMFVAVPFVIGAATAFVYNRRVIATVWETLGVTMVSLGLTAGCMFLVAFEGALCLVMAAPLAIPVVALGGVVGRALALGAGATRPSAALIIIALPGVLTFDAASTGGRAVHEVRSEIVINASADRVWSNVIAFPPLAPPDELIFKAGVAYPIKAEIVGQGVGAIRYCVFSTGPFVEPVTAWEANRRLAFDVTSSPDPMREWSPYAGVHPAHLDGYFRSRRGEFRLIPLPDGRTRLEGSTWYELNMGPEGYWQMLTDALIHRIHLRVLDHIKRETERQVR